jgi:hypothetical protein
MKRIPQKQMQDFVYIDRRSDMALVGTIPEAHGEEIVAIGRYYLYPRTNRAEIALLVRDKWQKRGIGFSATDAVISTLFPSKFSGAPMTVATSVVIGGADLQPTRNIAAMGTSRNLIFITLISFRESWI